ncbi:hypothetical protein JTB14_011937 [Gonioctena quinquepunctata]|nr:hypothetical protein JTB14_011937 [Gonioctena quinquepunctata]
MAMFSISWLWFIVSIINVSYGQYEIPTVTLEAFQPQGFRASIKADPDINLFAFHGKVNKEINLIEPGDFTEDLKVPVGEYFTFFNPNLKLKVGDVIHYWVFVQYKKLGYRKDAQKWTVKELKAEPRADCTQSVTVTSDRKKVCKNTRIFEDNFKGDSLNNDKWILEQYVPGSPSVEQQTNRTKNTTWNTEDVKKMGRVRQHKTINSSEVEVINDDPIQPEEKVVEKWLPKIHWKLNLRKSARNPLDTEP